jgi:inward rectifier potassium channel
LRNRHFRIRRVGVEETFFTDLYHRAMRLTWSRFFSIVFLSFIFVNLFFAILFWIAPGSLSDGGLSTFWTTFTFSVETFSTIGYGNIYPTSDYGNLVVILEAATSLISTALLTGLIFSKFSRPSARIIFSSNILMTTQNGNPVLSVRLGNVRANTVFDGRARMTLLRDETSAEGEKLRRLVDMKLVRDETPLFSLSWTLFHIIDDKSPIKGVTLEEVKEKGWEIIVTFVGLDQDMAQTIAAHSTYNGDHVKRARKFVDMIDFNHGVRVIDFSKLHLIED